MLQALILSNASDRFVYIIPTLKMPKKYVKQKTGLDLDLESKLGVHTKVTLFVVAFLRGFLYNRFVNLKMFSV